MNKGYGDFKAGDEVIITKDYKDYFKANDKSFVYAGGGYLYVACEFNEKGEHTNGYCLKTLISLGVVKKLKISPLERLPKWW